MDAKARLKGSCDAADKTAHRWKRGERPSMTQRSPVTVLLLSIVTIGIYYVVWLAKTRGEMVALGADIPTTWFLIIPIANIFYLWKWSAGAGKVSNGQVSGPVMFLLMWFISIVGIPYAQSNFNKVGAAAV
jgi:hypothetical protein